MSEEITPVNFCNRYFYQITTKYTKEENKIVSKFLNNEIRTNLGLKLECKESYPNVAQTIVHLLGLTLDKNSKTFF